MSRLSDITNAAIKKLIGTMCMSKITLAINAASAATVKSTGAIIYMINGVFYTVAALAAQAITVTLGPINGATSYVQPALTTVYYTLGLNAAGTVCVVQGTYAGQTGVGGAGASVVGDGSMPDVPEGYCPIGIIKITTAAATTFTAGTTALDAAGVTATYYDVSVMPEGKL